MKLIRTSSRQQTPTMAFEPSDATYGFPYETPYDVQKQLMDHLYRSFAHGQVTVVESPTGTVRPLVFRRGHAMWLQLKFATRRANHCPSSRRRCRFYAMPRRTLDTRSSPPFARASLLPNR